MNRIASPTVPTLVSKAFSAMIWLVVLALPAAPLLADDHDPAEAAESPQARQSVTEHSIRIDGNEQVLDM